MNAEQNSQAQGLLFGPYQTIRTAGRGATSTVYEAMDTRDGHIVAVKVLAPMPHLSPERQRAQEARMEREARAVGRLSHPNVARILDVGATAAAADAAAPTDTRVDYLVMEFIRGETLRERLDRAGGALPLGEAARITDQAASGLDAIHAAGVVHRDIKPGNIMIDESGTVKLMDFGVARQSDDTLMTQAGTMVGSPAYMSPEQALGEPATAASDLWSLGVIVYEMVAGRAPFTGANIPAVVHEIAYGAPAPLPGHVPPAVADVLTRALARDPADRFRSAAALATAFRDAIEASPAVVPAPIVAASAPAAASRQYYYETAVNPLRAGAAQLAPVTRRRTGTLLRNGAAAAVLFLVLAGALALSLTTFRRPARRSSATGTTVAAGKTPASSGSTSHRRIAAVKPVGEGTASSSLVRPTPTPPEPKPAAAVAASPVPDVATPAAVPSPTPAPQQVASLTSPARTVPTPPVGEVSVYEIKPTPTPAAKPTPVTTRRPSPPPAAVMAHATPKPQPRIAAAQPRPAAAAPAAAPTPAPLTADPTPTPPVVAAAAPDKRGDDTAPAATTGTSSANEVDVNPHGLSGLWRGTFSRHAALLVINHVHDDGTFDGSMTVRLGGGHGSILLAVSGRVSDDASITFKETRVIDAPGPDTWDLGSETGHVDPPDGMEGEGRDVRGRTYTWSFQR